MTPKQLERLGRQVRNRELVNRLLESPIVMTTVMMVALFIGWLFLVVVCV
jgi:hypothetical protein